MLDKMVLWALLPTALFVGYLCARIADSKIRNRRILNQHTGLSRTEFVEYFKEQGIPPEIPAETYDYFRGVIGLGTFLPNPVDDIEVVYVIAGEDIDDALNAIIYRLGYELPHSGILSDWHTQVRTIKDAVRWLDWVRRKQ